MAYPDHFENIVADMNEKLKTILHIALAPSLTKCFKSVLHVILSHELDGFLLYLPIFDQK